MSIVLDKKQTIRSIDLVNDTNLGYVIEIAYCTISFTITSQQKCCEQVAAWADFNLEDIIGDELSSVSYDYILGHPDKEGCDITLNTKIANEINYIKICLHCMKKEYIMFLINSNIEYAHPLTITYNNRGFI